MNSLSLNEESVALLILHSILQYGPSNQKSSWCSESHQQLLNDHFVDQFIFTLNRHLDNCASNWQNQLALLVITMRILTLCNSTEVEKVVKLSLKCRQIGEKMD